jgi:peroxiredoxin Q/BCP
MARAVAVAKVPSQRTSTSMTPSPLNQLAPDFSREAHNGQQVSLADFRGKQVVVLYFYPKDGTPVCTKEACGFRDVHEEFARAGAAVIGVSADSLDRHRAFAAEHGLPFLLVSDEDGTLRKAFRVPKPLGLLPGRVTYVIDKQGIVRHVFSALFSAQRHVTEALDVVRRLTREDVEAEDRP